MSYTHRLSVVVLVVKYNLFAPPKYAKHIGPPEAVCFPESIIPENAGVLIDNNRTANNKMVLVKSMCLILTSSLYSINIGALLFLCF